jgi:hypothetical protein
MAELPLLEPSRGASYINAGLRSAEIYDSGSGSVMT